jgi:hypothetical protein
MFSAVWMIKRDVAIAARAGQQGREQCPSQIIVGVKLLTAGRSASSVSNSGAN